MFHHCTRLSFSLSLSFLLLYSIVISSRYVSASGLFFHPEHFVCSVCHKTLSAERFCRQQNPQTGMLDFFCEEVSSFLLSVLNISQFLSFLFYFFFFFHLKSQYFLWILIYWSLTTWLSKTNPVPHLMKNPYSFFLGGVISRFVYLF